MRLLFPLLLIAGVLTAAVYFDATPPRADFTFINRGEVFTLDPQRMSYMQDFRFAYALYEPLVRWNNQDFSIVPAAADLPEISFDQRTYTFHILPTAKWSNGDPVTAHDFAYSWQRLLWPDTAADYSTLLFVIDGAEEFFNWRTDQLAMFGRQGAAPSPAEGSTREAASALDLFNAAGKRFTDTVGIRAIDDRTLQVTLGQPCAYFLDLCGFAVLHPVYRPCVEGWVMDDAMKQAIRERGWAHVTPPPIDLRAFIALDPVTGRIEQKHKWSRPQTLVGNGPYLLDEWRHKRDMRLTRNPFYHRPEIVKNESVVCLTIEDANTTVLAYETGDVDWLTDVTAEYVPDMLAERAAYESRHRAEIDSFVSQGLSIDEALARCPAPDKGERRDIRAMPTFGTEFIQFNCRPTLADGRKNVFADPRVRRAFAMTIDKDELVRNVTRLNEPVAGSLVPRDSIPNYRTPAGLAFDRLRGRDQLASAGWKVRDAGGALKNEAGEEFPVIDLMYSTRTQRHQWMMLNLRDQLQNALGVRIELRPADPKFYGDSLQYGKFMISHGRWYGDYGDPTTFLDVFRTDDGNNDRGFSNPRVDQLLDGAARELDSAKRFRMLEECERYVMEEELPLVPICQLVQVYMYEPGRLKGLSEHPRLTQYLWQLEAGSSTDR
jgi:oligopeptide transport system substrate-binding protein